MPLLSNKHLILVRITVYVGYDSLRWLDSLNHGTLYFFRHRIFHSARVKLSLGHCIALLVVFIIGSFILLPFVCPETLLSRIRYGVYANELVIRIEFKRET